MKCGYLLGERMQINTFTKKIRWVQQSSVLLVYHPVYHHINFSWLLDLAGGTTS